MQDLVNAVVEMMEDDALAAHQEVPGRGSAPYADP